MADVMTPLDQLQPVQPDEGLYGVLGRLSAADVYQMPVMHNGQLLGMVARDRVLAFVHTDHP